jgi:hypothetical protein
MISQAKLKDKIKTLLDNLYQKRIKALNSLTLSKLLNKNPYLYRAIGINDPSELVEQLLIARVSSSDETIFGNDFFEPLAQWSAKEADRGGKDGRNSFVGKAAGEDLGIETATAYLSISIKSGKNIFNAQSTKGQNKEFDELQARLRKLGKQFRPIIGYGYGRKNPPRKPEKVERLAGQAFWRLISGEEGFYTRISDAIGFHSSDHQIKYREAFDKKRNSLLRELMLGFVSGRGVLNWNAIVQYNSGEAKPERLKNN